MPVITQHGRPSTGFKNYPQFDEKRGGSYAITLPHAEQSYYTGLQVAEDPGGRVVWLGRLLMASVRWRLLSLPSAHLGQHPAPRQRDRRQFGGAADRSQLLSRSSSMN